MPIQPLTRNFELGNSLNQLAADFLPGGGDWRDIADLNGLNIFEALPIGSEIRLPTADDIRNLATDRLSQLGSLPNVGDLSAIASTKLGNTNPWQLIDWLYG